MVNSRKIIFILFLLFKEVLYSQNYININNNYLESNEMKMLEKQCLSGDLTATNVFIDYLQLNSDYISEEIINWEEIAAENEIFKNQRLNILSYNYALSLIDIQKDDIRAIFWMKKSNFDKADYSYNKLLEKYDGLFSNKNNSKKSKKIDDLIILAKLGDIESAEKMYDYSVKNKNDDSTYWCRIGSQNGSKRLMLIYSDILKQSNNENDLIRSEFWEKILNIN